MSEYTVDSHFEGKEPITQRLYEHLLARLREFGTVTEAPKKTSIHLDHRSGFAGVTTRKSAVHLNFRTDYRIEHPHITKMEQHSAHRFMHTVKLEKEADLDDELLKWLRDAYELAG
jgi:hypothetical protein